MILSLIVICTISILFLIPAYSENSDYSLSGNYHDYKIELFFSNGIVNGTITNNEKIINLDNSKLIERGWGGILIIDNKNDLKIISKKINDTKQLTIVKIKPDTKLRFITTIDNVKKITGQRDLFSAMNEKLKLDESNLSFKELEYLKKKNLINQAQQREKNLKNLIQCNYMIILTNVKVKMVY